VEEEMAEYSKTLSTEMLLRVAIVYRLITDLKPDSHNPRRHSRKQIRQIANAIKVFGFIIPIVIDRNGRVICGHGRLLAADLLGLTEVPTIMVEHLTEAQMKAFQIADNRLTELSEWNEQLLAEQLSDLSVQNLDFDLEITGFETGEIDFQIEGLSSPSDKQDDPADALPVPYGGSPVSRAGDFWQLDAHRVLCASADDGATFGVLMNGEKASMVFSDPPYNVPIEGNVSGLGAIKHRNFAMGCGEMSPTEFIEFLARTCSFFAANSAEGSLHFICMDWRHVHELITAGRIAYHELKNICIWVKSTAGMGSLYRSRHEMILVFKSGRAPHRNNVLLGKYGRSRTNVWLYPSVNSFGRKGEEGDLLAMHPTVKPAAMVADAILDCTARGEIVLDGFLGSGTTVIAAQRTGRRCYGLEIDPFYVDTIVRRWQAFTGDKAIEASTGRSFDQLRSERGEED
jgi:DNA modification methylase